MAVALVSARWPPLAAAWRGPRRRPVTLLNVSYDPTREFYQEINAAFTRAWEARAARRSTINQSHGGSGKQARSVIDGLEADVVTLALAYDIDAIRQRGCIAGGWQARLPAQQHALHLRDRLPGAEGKPEGHQGLGRPGQAGDLGHHAEPEDVGRRALELPGRLGLRPQAARAATDAKAREFVARLFRNVPVLDSGRAGRDDHLRAAGDRRRAGRLGERGAARRREDRQGQVSIVVPSLTILAEPPVAVVDAVVDRRGTRRVAQAYLEFLYTPEAQEIAARHHFRPRNAEVLARHRAKFPEVRDADDRPRLRRVGGGAEARTSTRAGCSTRSSSGGK